MYGFLCRMGWQVAINLSAIKMYSFKTGILWYIPPWCLFYFRNSFYGDETLVLGFFLIQSGVWFISFLCLIYFDDRFFSIRQGYEIQGVKSAILTIHFVIIMIISGIVFSIQLNNLTNT